MADLKYFLFLIISIYRTNFNCRCDVRFDLSGRTPLPLHDHVEQTVEACSAGRCDAVLMWWELNMTDDGQMTLSTAPYWAHATPHDMQVSGLNTKTSYDF